MKQTINEHDFIEGFRLCNRENNFTVGARRALYEYLCDLEDDMGEEMEFDPIAICCEFTQWDGLNEIIEAYGFQPTFTMDDLRDHTTVIEVEDFDFSGTGSIFDAPMITSIITQDW
jgi:hypothetical protein